MDACHSKSILIIDDHPVYRDALSELLKKTFVGDGVDVEVASSTSEGLELIARSEKRWVILLDIVMPGVNGVAGIKIFKELHSVEQIVAISGLNGKAWEDKTIAAGASLFLSKNESSEFIIEKLKPIIFLQAGFQVASKNAKTQAFKLSQRQLEVLDLISHGHSNKVIGNYLNISEQTVKIHVNLIFKTLEVFNRTQALIKAQKFELLPAQLKK